jgi:hypothetical protein
MNENEQDPVGQPEGANDTLGLGEIELDMHNDYDDRK